MEQNKEQSNQVDRDQDTKQDTKKEQVPASRFGKPQIRQQENQPEVEDQQNRQRKQA